MAMINRLIPLAASLSAVAAAGAALAGGDRHPGVYQFAPLPPGWCAGHQPQDWAPEGPPARLTPLGDLPPAYVIRINAPASTPPPPSPLWAGPPARTQRFPYEPCARVSPALVRVR